MNILPKKRWHVRTKENITRVRRDEAKAAEEESKQTEALKYAENEARLQFLRAKAGALPVSSTTTSEKTNDSTSFVDLFSDFQSHVKSTNKDHEKEQKEEKEKYEKSIGYLTYLGQDTNEALKRLSWYEIAPNRKIEDEFGSLQKDLKTKTYHDPLTFIKSILPEEKVPKVTVKNVQSSNSFTELSIHQNRERECADERKHLKEKKKHKKEKHKHEKHKKKKPKRQESPSPERTLEKKKILDKLREERLRREARERERQHNLLGIGIEKPKSKNSTVMIRQKYNSQYNPELAKQNMV